jgi:hypothetical protein
MTPALFHLCKLSTITVDLIRSPGIDDVRHAQDKEWREFVQCLRILCKAYIGLQDEVGWKPRFRVPMGRMPG